MSKNMKQYYIDLSDFYNKSKPSTRKQSMYKISNKYDVHDSRKQKER